MPAVAYSIGNAELDLIDTDGKLNAKIRSLNAKQREIFDFVYEWNGDHQEYKSSSVKKEIKTFQISLIHLCGMHLKSKYTKSAIKINKAADGEYTRIRTQQ